MLCVVTARGIVEGHLPPEPARHLFDRVAYTGIVPVKIVGAAGREPRAASREP
eukprot:SAG22_NODE_11971_length_461_cov_1.378453_2_plen_52_part_01